MQTPAYNQDQRQRRGVALVGFLVLVGLWRCVHLWLLPSWVLGMNLREVLAAKRLLDGDWGHAILPAAPMPSLVLAGISGLVRQPPSIAIGPVLLAAHLLLAGSFWRWLEGLELSPIAVRWALLIFVCLPALNSYEGFRNLAALSAAALALLAISIRQRRPAPNHPGHENGVPQSVVCKALRSRVLEFALFAACVMCRVEYLLLLPLYFLLEAVFIQRSGTRGTRFPDWSTLGSGLAIGAALTMTLHAADGQGAVLTPPGYACWTFLDGTPHPWLNATDDSEAERVQRGAEIFGSPAQYSYSLRRLIVTHPLLTAEKALLNLPRWLTQQAGRLVVVPWPLFVLYLEGLLTPWAFPSKRVLKPAVRHIVSLWLMTLPLTAAMVYSEYLWLSLLAMCAGAGIAMEALIAWLLPLRFGEQIRKAVLMAAAVLLVIGLEAALLRGGGTYQDAPPPPYQLARWLDDDVQLAANASVVLDPEGLYLEAFCNRPIFNAVLVDRVLRANTGALPPAATFGPQTHDVLKLCEQSGERPDAVFLWTIGRAEVEPERVRRWENLGYAVSQRFQSEDQTALLLRRTTHD